MEHLHNFLKEIQSLKIEIVKFHVLKDGKHLQDGQQRRRKVEKTYSCYIIPQEYISGNGKHSFQQLASVAMTEVLLCTIQQQKNILAKCKLILAKISDLDKGAKLILNPEKDLTPLAIQTAIKYSFPLTVMPDGKPDRSGISMLSMAINKRQYAIAEFARELTELLAQVNKPIIYSSYVPPVIKDPYTIIDCARYGLHYIYQLFSQQLKPEWVRPENAVTGKVYRKEDMMQVRFVNSFQIAQELPFIDFSLFTNAVRRLLYNVSNKDELLLLLNELITSATKNVELFQTKIETLEILSRDIDVNELPEDDVLREFPVYTGNIKYLIMRSDKRLSTIHQAGMTDFNQLPSEYYSNIRLAQFSDNVRVFLSREALHQESKEVEFYMSDDDVLILNTIDEYLEPFKGAIRENDYKSVAKLFFDYLKNGSTNFIKPVFVEKGNSVKLALACGKLCKAIKPEGINYEFLILLKNTFSIYADMEFDETNYRSKPLYKHCTRKK